MRSSAATPARRPRWTTGESAGIARADVRNPRRKRTSFDPPDGFIVVVAVPVANRATGSDEQSVSLRLPSHLRGCGRFVSAHHTLELHEHHARWVGLL
jgi:hypothetical protein